MDGFGEPEQVLAAVAGAGTLLTAAFPGAAVPHADPYNGLPYDDDLDAAFPASFPEDPFPEVCLPAVLSTRTSLTTVLITTAFLGTAHLMTEFPPAPLLPGTFRPVPLQQHQVRFSRPRTSPLTMPG